MIGGGGAKGAGNIRGYASTAPGDGVVKIRWSTNGNDDGPTKSEGYGHPS